jgi:hypothetical protein
MLTPVYMLHILFIHFPLYWLILCLRAAPGTSISTAHVHPRASSGGVHDIDTSCDNAQAALIRKAYVDAIWMATLVHNDTTDISQNAAFWELFGPDAHANRS